MSVKNNPLPFESTLYNNHLSCADMTGWYVDAESIPVPRFSPEVRTVLDSREEILPRIWKCMVREAANFYLKKYPDLKSSTLYQQIGYRVFSHYPWIDSYCSGRRPWVSLRH